MSYWVMPVSGKTVSDTTVQHVTRDDMLKPEVKEKIEEFDTKLKLRLDDTNFQLIPDIGNHWMIDE